MNIIKYEFAVTHTIIWLQGNVDDAIQQRVDNFTDIWNSDAYSYDYYNYYGDSYSNNNNDDMNAADNSTVEVAASISPGNIKKELLYAELTHLTWYV